MAQNTGGGDTFNIANNLFSAVAGTADILSDMGSVAAYNAFLRDGATFKLPSSGAQWTVRDPRLVQGLRNAKNPLTMVANSNLGTSQLLRSAATGARWAGVAGSVVTVGIALHNIGTGNGSVMDGVDIGVSMLSVAVPYLVVAGTISNPVGWVIGAGVIGYNLYRAYDAYEGN